MTAQAPARPLAGSAPPTAVGMVLGGIVSVQVGGAVAATLFDRVGPLGVVVLRLVSAAVVMLVWVRPWRRTWSGADVRVVVGFGAVLGIMNMTFYEALSRLPLGATVTLEVLGPLTVAVATGRRWRDGVWALLAFTGVLALGGGNLGLNPVGVLFGLAAAVCWGLYILMSVVSGRRFAGQQGTAGAMVVAALLVCPFGVPQLAAADLTTGLVLAGAAVGIASSVIPYSLEQAALRRLPPAVFGVLMSLEPAVATLAGLVILGQRLSPLGVLAVALVVAASAGASLTGRASTPVPTD